LSVALKFAQHLSLNPLGGNNVIPLDVRNPTPDIVRNSTPEIESYMGGGLSGKQVSFQADEHFLGSDVRPERRPNSYNCDPSPNPTERYMGGNSSAKLVS